VLAGAKNNNNNNIQRRQIINTTLSSMYGTQVVDHIHHLTMTTGPHCAQLYR